ncbi:MAG: SMP-30/gluconolactonase/LRE family protein [Burkholderiaceae bacterium]
MAAARGGAGLMAEAHFEPLPGAPSQLGESPFWHPHEGALYWCDIPGRRLERWHAASGQRRGWPLPSEPGCCAPLLGGGVLLAMRDGLWRFDTGRGERELLCAAPYDTATQRFNDGKADPLGRLWASTIHEPRDAPLAQLYRFAEGVMVPMAQGATTGNGLAFSLDARTLYWSDTPAHTIYAFDFDLAAGTISRRRVFARFTPRDAAQPPEAYGGRPDGAAVDAEAHLWVAMFEGARVVRLSPAGSVVDELRLPVRCPTMPCFGGDDLRTLFVTTARRGRSAAELAFEPDAGHVLHTRVAVQGLPVNFARA